jgi:hypothetical protein
MISDVMMSDLLITVTDLYISEGNYFRMKEQVNYAA